MAKRRTARPVSKAKRRPSTATGKPKAKRAGPKRSAAKKTAKAEPTLRDSAAQLGGAAVARTRVGVARNMASAREAVQSSLDRLGDAIAQSGEGVKREMGLLSRGLEAGLRVGAEAYRRKGRKR